MQSRPGPAWPNERERQITIAGLVVLVAVTAGNLVAGDLGYLQVLMLTALVGPMGIFYNTIRDATRVVAVEPEPRAEDRKDRPRMAGKPPARGR